MKQRARGSSRKPGTQTHLIENVLLVSAILNEDPNGEAVDVTGVLPDVRVHDLGHLVDGEDLNKETEALRREEAQSERRTSFKTIEQSSP